MLRCPRPSPFSHPHPHPHPHLSKSCMICGSFRPPTRAGSWWSSPSPHALNHSSHGASSRPHSATCAGAGAVQCMHAHASGRKPSAQGCVHAFASWVEGDQGTHASEKEAQAEERQRLTPGGEINCGMGVPSSAPGTPRRAGSSGSPERRPCRGALPVILVCCQSVPVPGQAGHQRPPDLRLRRKLPCADAGLAAGACCSWVGHQVRRVRDSC